MPYPRSTVLALLFSSFAAAGPVQAQRPLVQRVAPTGVQLTPGDSSQRLTVSGSDLHWFDSAVITYGGRNLTHVRAILDDRADPRVRYLELAAERGAGAVSGATLTLLSSRLRTSLGVPVRIDVVVVEVLANQSPTAVVSAPRTVPYGGPLVLSGGPSFDSDGEVVRWTWTLVSSSGVSGGDLQLNQPVEMDVPTFDVGAMGTVLAAGDHQFRLVVTDDAGQPSQPVVVVVTVLAP